MQLRRVHSLLALLLYMPGFASPARAQARPNGPDSGQRATGTVTGHVYFAGSNAPARLVNVALQPMQVEVEHFVPGRTPALNFQIYQTALDGSYEIPHVPPGNYYVVVNEPGYLSPFSEFTPDQLAKPTPEIARRMAAILPAVSVRANATSSLDLTLQRGAELSGTLRFDDGTPLVGTGVFVDRRGLDGKWIRSGAYSSRAMVDVDGHWQLSGLAPGEYRLRFPLSLSNRRQSSLFDGGSSSSQDTYTLVFYSGDTARERDEQTVKLQENEQHTGWDLTIPASRLHTVEGSVVDAGTGQPLNAGTVRLVYADDSAGLVSVDIDRDSRTFTLPFVPEGDYKLLITDAKQVRFEPLPSPDGNTTPTADAESDTPRQRRITVRSYAPGQMPLSIQTDLTGINLAVEPAGSRPQ